MKTIYVKFHDGESVEVGNIPDESKVTFSAVNPQSPSAGGPRAGYCLRIYKGSKDNGHQLAVFQGVTEFHDTSITITRQEKKSWIDG